MDHELFTHMLFVDAVIGCGFGASYSVADLAVEQGLAHFTGKQHNQDWAWDRPALEALDLNTLQELYTGLKLQRVTHAS